MIWLAVALGGAAGALARYGLSSAIYSWLGRDFPWGTLAVNVLGSAAIGVCFAFVVARLSADEGAAALVQSALVVGFLGAFTTFSTFSLETIGLLEAGETGRALVNAAGSVVLCVAACFAGLLAGRQLFGAA